MTGTDLPAILEMLDPGCEWEMVGPPALEYCGGPRRGREAIAGFFAQVAQYDDIHAFEPRQFLPGPDHVTVLGWERTTPKPKGRPFETQWVHVWTFRDGRVTGFKGFYDTATALAARG